MAIIIVTVTLYRFEPKSLTLKASKRAYGLTIVLGSYFVSNGEGFVRLNIGMQREKVLEALERMKKLYDKILSMRQP